MSKHQLHVLVDSREASVSFAKVFFERLRPRIERLGRVEHFQIGDLGAKFRSFLDKIENGDICLVSARYLPPEQLEQVRVALDFRGISRDCFAFATYGCFAHVKRWCEDTGCRFEAISFKKRELDATNPKAGAISFNIERIWIQYRLMLAIICRSVSLDKVCQQLIVGQPCPGSTLENERQRAIRYFRLGEPDMAGGSYACECPGSSNPIDELRINISKVAATDFNVLIQGESGSGKEVVAWAIHEQSARRDKPYIALNCAGLPEELLESEMFGYMKGSHNQAHEDSPGILGAAQGGTVFLDELPEMGPRVQAKFLRFLECGEYRPLGALENRYAHVRIIAAGQPERLVFPDRVRPDLKNRIGQLELVIPPLREMEQRRPETIAKITYILLERYTWTNVYRDGRPDELSPLDIKKYQDKIALPENSARMARMEWRESNTRELNNFLRRWMVFGDGELRRLESPESHAESERMEPNRDFFHDEALRLFLTVPTTREEFKDLLRHKPLQNLKKAYLRHLFQVFSRIVENENRNLDMPKRATQKELARLMDVTENTISRHLS